MTVEPTEETRAKKNEPPILSDVQAIKDKWFSADYQAKQASIYGARFVNQFVAIFKESPTQEEMVPVILPDSLTEAIRQSTEFIFDQACALKVAPEDWGHGHLYVSQTSWADFIKLKDQIEPSFQGDVILAQHLLDNWTGILWHTQEFYDSQTENYPLDRNKRSIIVLKDRPPRLVQPTDKDRQAGMDGLSAKNVPLEFPGMVNTIQFQVRKDNRGQVGNSQGKILVWIPHLIELEGKKRITPASK